MCIDENNHVRERISSIETKFPKLLTENNQDIFDTYYFGYSNDFRKMSVPLAGIVPLQTKTLLSESETKMRNDCT